MVKNFVLRSFRHAKRLIYRPFPKPDIKQRSKKYGLKLGAQNVVAGTNIPETIESIKELNAHGISCTVDNLGEFVYHREEATAAKIKS